MGNGIFYILMTLAMIAWGETWVSARILMPHDALLLTHLIKTRYNRTKRST